MCTALKRVLPRKVNLSTTSSFCPFIVMVGSLYGFPGAGWCTTSVFFVLIVMVGSLYGFPDAGWCTTSVFVVLIVR